MIWSDRDECPLIARGDQRATVRSKGIAVVGRAKEIDAVAAAKVVLDEIDIAVPRSTEVIDGDPFLVLEAAGFPR